MLSLRPYQTECVDAVLSGMAEFRKQLVVSPTGSGKTLMFSWMAERLDPKRVCILAHREELIEQAIEKLHRATGIFAQKEKAEHRASLQSQVVVGSIQTMQRDRLQRWPKDHFDLVIVDEAHHILADSYKKTLAHFDSHAAVVGVTATPDRGDKKNLGQYFNRVAFEIGLFDLINQKYLAPIVVKSVPLEIDLTKVRTSKGDYDEGDLGDALLPYLRSIAIAIREEAAFRRTLVFVPLIATSKKLIEVLESEGISARHVDGTSEDRKQILIDFENGEFQVLVNAMLLCLDEKTEILTSEGWKGVDSILPTHKVANWNFDGSVFFKEPEEIVKRPLSESEHMVSIDSRTINLRITNTHRMIVGCGENHKNWKKVPAEKLRQGMHLPSCGSAKPFDEKIDQIPLGNPRRRIAENAYNLRKNNGIEYFESLKMATEREAERRGLKFKQPNELSEDECRLIGFWIADGSRRKLIRKGVEYTLCQSAAYPRIVEWIDRLLSALNIHSIKRNHSTKACASWYTWSLPRGTGGGCQKRSGLFPLEPYLVKNGTHLFWGFNESQFDAMVEGYWYGDGHHGQAENGFPRSVVFNDTKFQWIELLCSIGPVRGWRCAMFHMPSKNPNHKDQWRLRMIKGMNVMLSSKTPIIHEPFQPERVWCVKTESKNIITRRCGKVTIMGNTEGYDCPHIECLVVLRPTKSRSLFSQMVGRGTRIAPGKQNLLLLDFLWLHEKHNLIRPAHLIASTPQQAQDMTEIIQKAGGETQEILDLQGVASEAQVMRELKLQEELKAKAKRKARTMDAMDFCLSVHAVDMADWEDMSPSESQPPTEKQSGMLDKHGIDLETVKSKGHASAIIDLIQNRARMGLATPKQVRFLKQFGCKSPEQWTFESATLFITSKISGRSYGRKAA